MKTLLLYLEHIFVFLNKALNKLLNKDQKVHILTYGNYGNGKRARILGRVIEKVSNTEFSKELGHLKHLNRVIKLFMAKKVADVSIEISHDKEKLKSFKSNSEGFFSEVIELEGSPDIRIGAEAPSENLQLTSKLSIKEIASDTPKIFISDMDDTVIKSKAVSMKSLILKTLFSPLSKREAFDEVSRFYNRLANGIDGTQTNQFFYVSSSTWNLYPLLKGFLKEHAFPCGPLLLQDIATEKKKSNSDSHQHKSDRIKEILDFFPDSKYTLIGDAGQKDAPIYLQLAEDFPEQIELILIRHTWWTKEAIAPIEYIKKAEELDVPLVYFDNLENLDQKIIKIFES